MRLITIILAKNEERHIERALSSVAAFSDGCFVIDSGSTDRTCELAQASGATVLRNAWVNYATQFNWALDEVPRDTQWILRLDADEYVTPMLAEQITNFLKSAPEHIAGLVIPRRINFMGSPVRWGGIFPIHVVRVFRLGKGRCENRWMDEHIIVDGNTSSLTGEIIDDNSNSLTWWTEKHNSYASREVLDLLNLEYGFMAHETVATLSVSQRAGLKRWLKEHIYAKFPIGMRALFYFIYRYFLRLGCFDVREGTAFHILQGFWYRYLVDMKLYEVKKYMKSKNVDVLTAIYDVLNIKLN